MHIHCLCGAIDEEISEAGREGGASVEICHCYGCRHSTGLLYSSYVSVNGEEANQVIQKNALGSYREKFDPYGTTELHFCKTCGSQLFRAVRTGGKTVTGVASGVIASIDGDEGLSFVSQANAESTTDGGISRWMSQIKKVEHKSQHFTQETQPSSVSGVAASCLCTAVKFRLTPPNDESSKPRSGFADSIIPFHTNDPEIKNPNDVKWWLRESNTKYAASLCACKTCRLASGFEIQSWAFVPRTNIEFRLDPDKAWSALNFDTLRERGIVQTFDSSAGVQREFCSRCGATLFWHDKWRPDLIDVSVGLIHSEKGALAEDLLDWVLQRISFAEDAPIGRSGSVAATAVEFVNHLEQSMKISSEIDA